MIEFLRWALTDGAVMTKPLDYTPLPKELRDRVSSACQKFKWAGRDLVKASSRL